jgi:hypothetical protein
VCPVGIVAVLKDVVDACESGAGCEGGADVAGRATDLADEACLQGDGDLGVGVLHLLRDEHGARAVTEAEVRNGLVGVALSGGAQHGLELVVDVAVGLDDGGLEDAARRDALVVRVVLLCSSPFRSSSSVLVRALRDARGARSMRDGVVEVQVGVRGRRYLRSGGREEIR